VELRQPGRAGVFLRQTPEQLVQRQHEVGVLGEGAALIEQLGPGPVATPLEPTARTGGLDEDASHRCFPAKHWLNIAVPGIEALRAAV
jgi:hypothetical protein